LQEEVCFKLTEGNYSYLEWPPLTQTFIEKPYFLTLDDKGKLRLHDLQKKTQEVLEPEETYRSAAFSVNGREIYAINENQELCIIDFCGDFGNQTVLKRKIPGLDEDPQKVISNHILQITPYILAIGSIIKTTEIIKPYLHIICGDLLDLDSQLKIKEFYLPKLESLGLGDPIIFRSVFIKERQLLLSGHTAADKVYAIDFGSGKN